LEEINHICVLTQAELAEEVSASVITISHWKNGSKRPKVSNIRKLAKGFQVRPQEVLAVIRDLPE
jgi:transcriptional regulator with XRE-family HTH domain